MSNFSTVSSLCIHGGKRHEINTVVFTHYISLLLLLLMLLLSIGFEATRYPKLKPHSLRYKVHLDSRPGFERNIVIQLSWKKPEGKVYICVYQNIESTTAVII